MIVVQDSDSDDENDVGDTEEEERRRVAEFKNMVQEKVTREEYK